jgi:hypothetical protein
MRIQRLEEFHDINEDFDLMGIVSGLGSGASNVLKGIVADYIMDLMGFDKESFMGKIIKNTVYRMELTQITKYFAGDKKSIGEWADALVIGLVGALEEELLDKVFVDMMKIEKDSVIYKVLRESFKNAINDDIFKNHIKEGVVKILEGENAKGKGFSTKSILGKINK